MQNSTGQRCPCPHHKIIPGLITLIGVVFLLGNLSVISAGAVQITWPILLTLIGLNKLFAGACKCCSR